MNIPELMIQRMMEMLDCQDELCRAYDKVLKTCDSRELIRLVEERSKESDKYVILYHAFSKLLNCDYNPHLRIYYFIRNDDGKHSVYEGEL